METTKEQDEKIGQWFNKWKPVCQVCKSKKWSVNAALLSMNSLSSGDPSQQIGSHVPVVLFICENCGNTLSVAAVKANIIPGQENS